MFNVNWATRMKCKQTSNAHAKSIIEFCHNKLVVFTCGDEIGCK